ncbi:MAG: hypothetical protein K2J62_06370 [Bacteroidales bacterium]|nr:hypothetical protein [Bacteroidales bacterium]
MATERQIFDNRKECPNGPEYKEKEKHAIFFKKILQLQKRYLSLQSQSKERAKYSGCGAVG